MRKAIIILRAKVDKILNYKSISIREKVDRLLEINAKQYQNLGTDSLKYEREEAERNSRYIYKAIKSIDERTGKLLLRYREE
jgi:hypothetical protein